jgi:hypothetical protein
VDSHIFVPMAIEDQWDGRTRNHFGDNHRAVVRYHCRQNSTENVNGEPEMVTFELASLCNG